MTAIAQSSLKASGLLCRSKKVAKTQKHITAASFAQKVMIYLVSMEIQNVQFGQSFQIFNSFDP